ncbi:PREDICTED: UDP-glycosyltransferase 87A2-like [Ipomoea nil]|uniref:UDP-glycosyltransferase 87A2-like n=1 Tax=Ipomoea nil TaxID=35883 RepID=UPI00090094C5|nr:PREDICTED: UDP-glycosyltransferase 87A2-like [Ipomoea nil]
MECDAKPKCHVVAVPYPGRGHVNPMMNLCKLIAVHRPDTVFTFILTQEWYGFIAADPKPENLRFATVPNVIPSEIGRAKDFAAFFRATQTELEAPVEELLDRLDRPKPNVIIHDTYLPWVVSLGIRKNIPVASLFTMSAATLSVFLHWDLLVQNGHSHNPNISERVNYLPGVPSIEVSDLPTPVHGKGNELVDDVLKVLSMVPKAQYLLFASVYELEAPAIDAIKQSLSSLPIHTIGPAIPYFSAAIDKTPSNSSDHIIKWLDSQPESSVVYISQGSFLSVSSSQLDEIVAGVHGSGVRFLWVTRAGEESQFRRENNAGCLVVRWCNQFEVLRHRAVGGFWSHCGWNSAKEAAFAGVPVLTFPIFWDQTTNSKIIVEDWKMGVKVKRGDNGGLVGRGEIGGLLKRFMDLENAEMKEMRRRAKMVQQICHTSMEKGGSSYVNIDAFIKEIS